MHVPKLEPLSVKGDRRGPAGRAESLHGADLDMCGCSRRVEVTTDVGMLGIFAFAHQCHANIEVATVLQEDAVKALRDIPKPTGGTSSGKQCTAGTLDLQFEDPSTAGKWLDLSPATLQKVLTETLACSDYVLDGGVKSMCTRPGLVDIPLTRAVRAFPARTCCAELAASRCYASSGRTRLPRPCVSAQTPVHNQLDGSLQ